MRSGRRLKRSQEREAPGAIDEAVRIGFLQSCNVVESFARAAVHDHPAFFRSFSFCARDACLWTDVSEPRFRNLLRKEFEALGGVRIQFSLHVFEGEDHEADRRTGSVEGDIRLIPMDFSVWKQQIVLLGNLSQPAERPFPSCLLIWSILG